MFHKEGQKIIFITLLIVGSLFLVIDFIQIPWLVKTLQIGLLIFFVLILQFFRNPKRYTKHNDAHVISPSRFPLRCDDRFYECFSWIFFDKGIKLQIFFHLVGVIVLHMNP